jgi:hypothetical protein
VLPPNGSTTLPRYFFNIHDGSDLIDKIGTELTDVTEARIVAVDFAGQAIHDLAEKFWELDDPWRLDVSDEAGLVFTLQFSVIRHRH